MLSIYIMDFLTSMLPDCIFLESENETLLSVLISYSLTRTAKTYITFH
jgi:hypothetical protein